MRFHSGGQGPILHFQSATGTCVCYKPTSFPLGAMRLESLPAAMTLDMGPGDILLLLSDGIYEYRSAHGEDFGQTRVEAIVRDHQHASAAELAATLLDSVRQFAAGARQEDDITVVLVKREAAMTAERTFRRSFESIPEIFAFTAEVFASERVDPSLLPSVDLTLEELFTNMVKYDASDAAVRIDIAKVDGGVEVTLIDYDVERFDVTQTPDVDIDLPIEQRQPGGLGLHLIRRLVDRVHYEYCAESRQSRITFRKTLAGASASDRSMVTGSVDAHD
jgi:anti-sigma regulatory factor (Ser/Thr protein kinase)